MNTCILSYCDRPRYTKGLCRMHNHRFGQGLANWSAPIGKTGPKPLFDWAACGTVKQYRKHLRQGIPVCESCRRAENRRIQDRQKKVSKAYGESANRLIS